MTITQGTPRAEGPASTTCPRTESRPCLACGGVVTADPSDPGPGVREHRASESHQAWLRGARGICPGCRMVRIPAHRTRCHGCRRELERRLAA